MSNVVRTALSILIPIALVTPHAAAAAVVINELAWMGSVGNANAEWIELYNEGSEPVSLSGWTLTSAGTAPNITLSGTIAGSGFYLLERTGDDSAPGVSADQIYTGALANGGDTLTLKDSSGSTVDQVVGGSGWTNIGGDNTTKDTPQRTGSSWVTATPTPRATNASGSTPPADTGTTTPTTPTETSTTTPSATIGGSTPSTSTTVASPVRALYLDAGPDRIVLAGVRTPYRAVAYSKNGSIKDARVTWSFGDGKSDLGDKVWHAFRKPGEYMVTVRAEEDASEALVALHVIVEAPSVALHTVDGGVALTNSGARLADLSLWRIRAGEREFEIPRDTGVWPGATVVFADEDTGLSSEDSTSLLLPSGTIASEAVSEPNVLEVAEEPPPVQLPSPEVGIERVETPLPASSVTDEPHETRILAPTAPTLSAAVGAAVPALPSSWLMCLFGGLLACGASLVVR